MTLRSGDTVWIPCDVKRSVFPDVRHINIESPYGRWAGFVDVRQLRDEIAEGTTAVRATIVRAAHGTYAARLPGQTMHHQYLTLTEA
jgi:hypothetical protein